MDYQYLNVDVDDGLATLQLNRPSVLNAMSPAMARELLAALTAVNADREVRAVLLTGAGRAFCAGADLGAGSNDPTGADADARSRLDELFHPIITGLRGAPKPYVAAINGPCVGLGVALALACDLTVAQAGGYFLLPFVRLGLSLDGGIGAFLADRIGLARASQLTMLGERLPVETAETWGMVNWVRTPEDFADYSRDMALKLASGPTLALSNIKQALSAAAHPRLLEQLNLESSLQLECVASTEYEEGRAAFRGRREPAFDVIRTM